MGDSTISGVAVGAVGAGIVLVYAGFKGWSVSRALVDVIQGKDPSQGQVPGSITGLTGPSTGGSGGAGTTATMPNNTTGNPAPADTSIQTQPQWAAALLKALGYPGTSANLDSINNWEHMEGGSWNNTALYNPLNTTQPDTGSTNASNMAQGNIQAYTSWASGLNATVTTLHNGYYPDILAALAAGKGLQNGIAAAGLLKWSDNGYSSV